MNRRSFLKRIAAVAAGAVVAPVAAKKLSSDWYNDGLIGCWKNKYRWVQIYGPYRPGEVNLAPIDYLNTVSGTPLHELGTMAITGDGRHYRYVKNCTAEQLIAGMVC